eukprot:843643-Pelagomonas_calceolata.AAC.6
MQFLSANSEWPWQDIIGSGRAQQASSKEAQSMRFANVDNAALTDQDLVNMPWRQFPQLSAAKQMKEAGPDLSGSKELKHGSQLWGEKHCTEFEKEEFMKTIVKNVHTACCRARMPCMA